jgi:hypothetical protein
MIFKHAARNHMLHCNMTTLVRPARKSRIKSYYSQACVKGLSEGPRIATQLQHFRRRQYFYMYVSFLHFGLPRLGAARRH